MYQVIFKANNRIVTKHFNSDELAEAVRLCDKVNGRLRLCTQKAKVKFP